MSTCGKVKEEGGDEEGSGREARGQMSWSPGGGGTPSVVVGGTGLSDQDQLVENGVCDG